MNHRSAPRLVDLQRKMYSVLNESDGQVQHSAKWREDDGIINLIISENSESEALTITNSIIKKIETGISPTQIYKITNTPLTLLPFCTIILHKRTFFSVVHTLK